MKQQITLSIIVLTLSILAMNFRCFKDPVSRPFDYKFGAAVDIYPLKKTMR